MLTCVYGTFPSSASKEEGSRLAYAFPARQPLLVCGQLSGRWETWVEVRLHRLPLLLLRDRADLPLDQLLPSSLSFLLQSVTVERLMELG
jgi:hypothetical protein